MDHVISADESEIVEIQMKTMDWTGELTELFNRANTEVAQGNPGTEEQIQQQVWHQQAIQTIWPDSTGWGPLDFHLTSSYDSDHNGNLPDWCTNLE